MNPILRSALSDRNRAALLAVMILFLSLFANGQSVYNPSNSGYFTPSNKPFAVATASPDGGRSMKLDSINRLFRPFNGVSEVYSYFPVGSQFRQGNFIIVVDSGGTLQSNGTYIGGSNNFYEWKDSFSNAGLIKMNLFGGGGCSGCLLAANNLSDLSNASLARSNLGLGTMATQNVAAGGDLSGNWNNITVAKFNGQLPSYYLNYANLTNTPPLVSLTTGGTSGLATYNSSTGVLNIPNYTGGGGSCLNCNADTIGNIPLNFVSFCNNCVLTLDSAAGYAYWAPSTGGTATLPPNIGSGYRISSPQIPGIRTLICNSGCTIDSTSNTNALTFNITGGGSGTVTAFTAGNLTPLFTTSVANGTTTPALSFTLSNAAAYNVFGNNTASPATPFYFAPNITILNQWSGGTIALLGNSQTFTGINTFSNNILFSANNTYNIGSITGVAAHVWSRVFESDAAVSLASTTGSPVQLDIGATPGITLLSTGQVQFNNYTSSGYSGTSADSILTINPATGAIGWRWGQPYNVYAVEGTSPAGYDSIQFGGSLGAFYKPDTLYTNGQPFYVYGLPDTVATNSSDSVLILNWNHQMKVVAVSAIGGGGAVSSVTDNGGGTLTISPNTGSVLAGINLGNADTWTATQSFNGGINVGSNIVYTGTTATYSIGSLTELPVKIYTRNLISDGNLSQEASSTGIINWAFNGTQEAQLSHTGQWQWGAYTSTTSFTLGSVVGMLVFDASGNIGTQAISGGGSVTINGTTGSATGSTLTFAVSGTSTTATGLTIPASGTTATWTYPAAWDFFDNTRASNLNVFGGPLVGNTSLTGQHNTGVGYQIMQNITSGNYNTAFGIQSGNAITTGSQNVLYGWVTGFNITTGVNNTMLGSGAGSGDTAGSYNVYVGQIAGDLNGQGNYNTAIGTEAMGAESGAPLWNTISGAYNTANWTGTDTAITSYGAFNDLNNLAHRKYTIEIGHHINYGGNFGLVDVIEIGDSINGGNGTAGFLTNFTAIGTGILGWNSGVAILGTKLQGTMLGDSGVAAHSNLSSMTACGSCIVFERDSAAASTGSGYFVYVIADAAWEQIPTTWHLPSGGGGFTNPMTTTGDIIYSSSGSTPARLGIGSTNQVLTVVGGVPTWQTPSGGAVALSSVTALTASTTINNGNFLWTVQNNTMTAGPGVFFQFNGTTATAGMTEFEVQAEGTSGTTGLTTNAAQILNQIAGGAASTNIGLLLTVSGAATNIGLEIPSTSTLNGIGGPPTATWDVQSSGATEVRIFSSSTAQSPVLLIGASATLGELYGLGSTYGGTVNTGFASSTIYLRSAVSGGLNLGAQAAAGDIRFFTGGEGITNLRGLIDSVTGRWHIDTVTGKSLFNISSTRADNFAGNGEGMTFAIDGGIITDNSSTGTVSNIFAVTSIASAAITDVHAGVTYTNAASFYIAGAPSVYGSNTTITNNWSLYVNAGNTYLGGFEQIGASGGTRTWNPNLAIIGSAWSNQPGTLNDATTSASGTVSNAYVNGITTPTLTATNTGVVYTNAFTLWVNQAPSAGTNVTITNSYAFGVAGNSLFNGTISAASVNLTGSADLTGQTGAVTVTSYAVPGSTTFNTFRVGGYITVTAVSLDVIQLKVTWTDETSTSRSQSFFVQGATTGIGTTGANAYSPIDIRVLKGTTITVATILTTGTGSITYDVGANITQLY